MLFTAIDHPAISCYDVRKLAEWYCNNLGMRIIAENDATPPAMIVGYDADAKAGAVIELMPVRHDGPNPAEFQRFQPGLRHMAIRVSDFMKDMRSRPRRCATLPPGRAAASD